LKTYVTVNLSKAEKWIAAREGIRRHRYDRRRNVKPRLNAPTEYKAARWINVVGSIGEYGAAKYLGLIDYLYTETKPIRDSVDLPPNIDVKTPQGHNRRLIVFRDGPSTSIYVLATFQDNELRLHGWLNGHEAKQDKYLDNPAGRGFSYYVPSSDLRPISLLKSYLLDLGYSK
jgi:hypothetical protein